MRIKLSANILHSGRRVVAGSELDLPDESARALIARGMAQPLVDPAPSVEPAAEASPARASETVRAALPPAPAAPKKPAAKKKKAAGK